MELNITIQLAEADRELVRDIVSAIHELSYARRKPDAVNEAQEPEPVARDDTPGKAENAQPDTPAPVKTGPDVEQIREDTKALIRQNARTHKDAIKALLSEFGAAKASEVAAEVLPEFFERLQAVVAA